MNSLTNKSIATGAILAGFAVALGAFGAHLLKPKLEVHYFEVFETAVRYQMYHAIALILLGLTATVKAIPELVYWLFLVGTLLFTLTLYAIVGGSLLENNPLKWMGAITPLGGLCLICAWFLFAFNTIKK